MPSDKTKRDIPFDGNARVVIRPRIAEHDEFPGHAVYYVNGISTDFESEQGDAFAYANQIGHEVVTIHAATYGTPGDLWLCFGEKVGPGNHLNPPERAVMDAVLREVVADGKVLRLERPIHFAAHSRGALIVQRGLENAARVLRGEHFNDAQIEAFVFSGVSVEMFEGAAPMPYGVRAVAYANTDDSVPMLFGASRVDRVLLSSIDREHAYIELPIRRYANGIVPIRPFDLLYAHDVTYTITHRVRFEEALRDHQENATNLERIEHEPAYVLPRLVEALERQRLVNAMRAVPDPRDALSDPKIPPRHGNSFPAFETDERGQPHRFSAAPAERRGRLISANRYRTTFRTDDHHTLTFRTDDLLYGLRDADRANALWRLGVSAQLHEHVSLTIGREGFSLHVAEPSPAPRPEPRPAHTPTPTAAHAAASAHTQQAAPAVPLPTPAPTPAPLSVPSRSPQRLLDGAEALYRHAQVQAAHARADGQGSPPRASAAAATERGEAPASMHGVRWDRRTAYGSASVSWVDGGWVEVHHGASARTVYAPGELHGPHLRRGDLVDISATGNVRRKRHLELGDDPFGRTHVSLPAQVQAHAQAAEQRAHRGLRLSLSRST